MMTSSLRRNFRRYSLHFTMSVFGLGRIRFKVFVH
uniref:Uncharacterized protein n=1 Tax=Arundo donax TaxID=35708 RepID=A0A0A8ZBX7_ARUDO